MTSKPSCNLLSSAPRVPERFASDSLRLQHLTLNLPPDNRTDEFIDIEIRFTWQGMLPKDFDIVRGGCETPMPCGASSQGEQYQLYRIHLTGQQLYSGLVIREIGYLSYLANPSKSATCGSGKRAKPCPLRNSIHRRSDFIFAFFSATIQHSKSESQICFSYF